MEEIDILKMFTKLLNQGYTVYTVCQIIQNKIENEKNIVKHKNSDYNYNM